MVKQSVLFDRRSHDSADECGEVECDANVRNDYDWNVLERKQSDGFDHVSIANRQTRIVDPDEDGREY